MCVVATTLIARAASGAESADLVVDQLRITQFKQTIADLASFGSRYWDQPGNALAVAYIRDKLESFGYANVTLDPYVFRGELRHNLYATKVGVVRPAEMYIVSAHLDSFSRVDVRDAPGADDDASGTALVLEVARVFASVETDVSIRFILFNNEETGLNGSRAYVAAHRDERGTLTEPTWLGVIQHDMILFDRFREPDADVEYRASQAFQGRAIDLAHRVAGAMARFGTLPAEVSDSMCCTDSVSFASDAPAISVRENRRQPEIGTGSNPHYHQPTDLAETYTEADYAFGFEIVKMTTGAVAELAGIRGPDCNANGVSDDEDIAGATSRDQDGNGVPDECERHRFGDTDDDGDIDLADYLFLLDCFSGPGIEPPQACCAPGSPDPAVCDSPGDLDRDGDIDLADVVVFQSTFTGSS